MNGNWRVWEPDVITFTGSNLRFFRARTLLVRDEDCLFERPPQILTGLRCNPLSVSTTRELHLSSAGGGGAVATE